MNVVGLSSRTVRAFTIAAATLGWAALLLQAWLTIPARLAAGDGLAGALVFYFSFFTVLTNILVASALALPLLAPASAGGRFFARPAVATGVATNIALAGLVYSLVLRQLWNPQGLQRVADFVLHDVMPVLFLIYWWIAVPKRELRWAHVAGFLLYPIVYFIYVMLRGALTGAYPYPFIDAAALGIGRALLNALGILVGFAVTGLVFIFLGRRQSSPQT